MAQAEQAATQKIPLAMSLLAAGASQQVTAFLQLLLVVLQAALVRAAWEMETQ
jgi:hypothetical protein